MKLVLFKGESGKPEQKILHLSEYRAIQAKRVNNQQIVRPSGIETAHYYQSLMKTEDIHSRSELARFLGVSRARVNITELQKAGLFSDDQLGRSIKVDWKRGDGFQYQLNLRVEVGNRNCDTKYRIILTSSTDQGKPDQDMQFRQQIEIIRIPCNFGGERLLFRCPYAFHEDDGCLERTLSLYRPLNGKWFGCRKCHSLLYESQYWHRNKFYETEYRDMQLANNVIGIIGQAPYRSEKWFRKKKLWAMKQVRLRIKNNKTLSQEEIERGIEIVRNIEKTIDAV